MRRIFSSMVALICLLSLLIPRSAMAGSADISVRDGELVIESPANTFAHILHPLKLQKEPRELSAQIKIRVEGAVGASWAPGVCLYWDANKWIRLSHTGPVFRMEGYIEGGWVREANWPVTPSSGWNALKLVWRQDVVDIYASPDGEGWNHLTYVLRPGEGSPWLIVGKGFGSTSNPYLTSSYSDPGGMGKTFIDEVVVMADGKTIFEEKFDSAPLDRERWVPIFSGDPELDAKMKNLNRLRAEKGGDIKEGTFFDLNRWETWRTKVKRPAGLYKSDLLERARENIRTHLTGRDELQRLKNEVKLVMGYDSAQIAHMIPETTPTSTLWTPSPLSDVGFPHGDWSWSPERPDEIICRASGRVFPNKDFPEDIVIVATYGGKEQRLTFHRSKDWVFNGFPLATSFTGNIRARKVSYMAAQVEKIGLVYALTGEEEYARQAKAILLRFAEVYPYYLVHSGYHEFADIAPPVAAENISMLPTNELVVPPNKPDRQLHAGYWMAGRATGEGMEGSFLMQVTNAYDLVADAVDSKGKPIFNEEEKVKIERDLLLEGTKLLLCDSAINNKTVSARAAVAGVGAVVGDPILVRWGYEGFRKVINDWFLSDGATSESPAYGLMVLSSLWKHGEIFQGYSDPEGYADESGQRFDNLDIYQEPKYQTVWQNMYLSMLPDSKYPPIADSYTTSTLSDELIELMALRFDLPEFKSLLKFRVSLFSPSLFYRDPKMDLRDVGPMSLPDVLFPAWRLAYLRGGPDGMDSAAILNISDWGGHHHKDSLSLYYWKDGRELLSDLGYLWDNPQAHMTSRTVAHNLVVVDEMDQRTVGRGGDVHLFHPLGQFKVTEGSSNAYQQASIYRRFVAQVEHPGTNSYLVDIFRVKGGSLHDYVYHGPGGRFITAGIDLKGDDTVLSKYQFTNVRGGSAEKWRITWSLPTGYLQVLTVGANDEQVLVADGWGQRATKDPYTTLPYVIRRRRGNDLASCYVSVYEGYAKKPLVGDARLLTLQGSNEGATRTVGIAIDAGGYRDYIFSAMEAGVTEGQTDQGPLRFCGLAGIASFDKSGELEILGIVGGNEIKIGEWGLAIEGEPLKGEIYETHEDGFTIDGAYPEIARYTGWELFVESTRIKTAYPIRKVEVVDGKTRIYTRDSSGGFPSATARKWYLPQVAYLERGDKGEYLFKGTGEVQITLPARGVSPAKLAYHSGDGRWEAVPLREVEGTLSFTLSPTEGEGVLYLRLK